MREPASGRRIVLLVEGKTERGDYRHQTLPRFLHRWLDPQLPEGRKVGINAVSMGGSPSFLSDLPQKVDDYLSRGKANFVIGLLDLYGLPDAIDLSRCSTTAERVSAAREHIHRLVPAQFRQRFHQHFAVHEIEAWLLAYPERFPQNARKQLKRRPPEDVNMNEPPSKYLKRLLGTKYMKTVTARNIFLSSDVDPQVAIEACPNLKLLSRTLLEVAKRLVR
jgi:hypothetical protein